LLHVGAAVAVDDASESTFRPSLVLGPFFTSAAPATESSQEQEEWITAAAACYTGMLVVNREW